MSTRHKAPHRFGLLIVALLAAMVLQLWPLFGGAALWRPHFVLLVLVFALLYRPGHYGIVTAWCVGLAMDVAYGGVLGRYALALGICAYLLQLFRRRLMHARLWHQSGLVFLLAALSQLIAVSVHLLVQRDASWAVIWYPAVTSALVWPVFYPIMMRLAKR